MSVSNISLIGLGSMGFGMATSLIAAGHAVQGFDINPDSVARLVTQGGLSGPQADAAARCEIVVVVVLNAEQTQSVLFGPSGWAT